MNQLDQMTLGIVLLAGAMFGLGLLTQRLFGGAGHAGGLTKHDLAEIERIIKMTQKELEDGLRLIQTQVGKVATEQATRFDTLTAKIAELEEVINSGGNVSAGVETALADVQTALNALDETIPDAPPA